MKNYTFDDLFDDTTYGEFVDDTLFLINRRRAQKKRSREWRKYRMALIAAGKPDPGRNRYTPNRLGSRKYNKENEVVTLPPPPPSPVELPEPPVIPIEILAELELK